MRELPRSRLGRLAGFVAGKALPRDIARTRALSRNARSTFCNESQTERERERKEKEKEEEKEREKEREREREQRERERKQKKLEAAVSLFF